MSYSVHMRHDPAEVTAVAFARLASELLGEALACLATAPSSEQLDEVRRRLDDLDRLELVLAEAIELAENTILGPIDGSS